MPVFKPVKKGVRMSEAIAEAYASAPDDVVILHTLEMIHPDFVDSSGSPTSARVVRQLRPITAQLEASAPMNPNTYVEFQGVYFDITLPSEEDSGTTGELQLVIDNAMGVLTPYLDAASDSLTPIKVIYRPYLSNDLEAPHIDPVLTMTLRNISADLFKVTARAGFGDLTNRRFPYALYNRAEHPGLAAR